MKKSLLLALVSLCVTAVLVFVNGRVRPPSYEYDVDLSHMSSTMVWAKVFDMMTNPEKYDGASVKIHGMLEVYEDESFPNWRIFSCMVQDSTACCQQGFEFVLAGNPVYPDDYPPRLSKITVSGTFRQFMQDGEPYTAILDARFH